MFEKLKEKCKTEYVSRKQLWDLTGGILGVAVITKFDSLGCGIKNRKIIGSRTMYPIESVIEWLEENTECIK
jgi:phage terminase Nu1 subunit (DNA packaging protein)